MSRIVTSSLYWEKYKKQIHKGKKMIQKQNTQEIGIYVKGKINFEKTVYEYFKYFTA